MTDCGDDYGAHPGEEDDDWFDDDPGYAKEEPNCHACNDSGWTWDPDTGWFRQLQERPCRACNPTRIDRIRDRLTAPIRTLAWRWRTRHDHHYDDEGPF